MFLSNSQVSENKVLCHPSSVDSLSTCADKEDHVSMGGMSARKAVVVTENVLKALSIEVMAATQAWYLLEEEQRTSEKKPEFRVPPLVKKCFEKVAKVFKKVEDDRFTGEDFGRVFELVKSGELFACLEKDLM